MIFLFLAFPDDYFRFYKGVICSQRTENVLKEFIFPTNMIIDATTALIECEKYCGRVERCWGCSAHTNTSNQWNAITKCGGLEKWEGLIQGDVTQKPGTEKMYILFIFYLILIKVGIRLSFNYSYLFKCSLLWNKDKSSKRIRRNVEHISPMGIDLLQRLKQLCEQFYLRQAWKVLFNTRSTYSHVS